MKYTTDLGIRYRTGKIVRDLGDFFRRFDPFGIFSKFLDSDPVVYKGYTPAFATAYAPSFSDLDPYRFYKELVGEREW